MSMAGFPQMASLHPAYARSPEPHTGPGDPRPGTTPLHLHSHGRFRCVVPPSGHDSAASSYAALVPDHSELPEVPAPLWPERVDEHRYTVANTGDAGQRDVVFGGQLLAQAIVVTSLRHPGKDVRSIQADLRAAPVASTRARSLLIDPMHDGRSFASDTVTAWQGERLCARFIVLLDADEPDVVRHDVTMPRVPGPDDAAPSGPGGLVYPGADVRIVDDVDLWNVDAPVGPAETFLWTRAPSLPDDPRGAPGRARVGDRRVPDRHRPATPCRHQPGRRPPRALDRGGGAHHRVPRAVPRRRVAAARAREPVRRPWPLVRDGRRVHRGRRATSPPTCRPT